MSLPFLCTGIDRILESSGDLGILIFDHHHDLAGIEKTLRTLRIGDGGALRTERQIEKGFFVDSAQSFPIQLIDLALYYIRKLEEERIGKKVSPIHQEVFPRLKILATLQNSARFGRSDSEAFGHPCSVRFGHLNSAPSGRFR